MTAEIPGITRAGTGFDGVDGTVWNTLGQTYYTQTP